MADHYDELDPIYRQLWGEHVHHGLCETASQGTAAAVEASSDHVIRSIGPAPGERLVDIGCGYGDTARRIARHRRVEVTGLTLSSAQVDQAPPQRGVTLVVCNWLANGLPDAAFDHGYAIESSEHMIDKQRFFAEAARVLKPGGRLVVCAWLARTDASARSIRYLPEPICRKRRLPSMGSREEYAGWAPAAGFAAIGYRHASRQVARTRTICAGRFTRAMLVDGALRRRVLPRLIVAYRCGAMRYGVFIVQKN